MPTPPRSGLSSRNSFDANNAFPRQAGHSVSKRDHGLISPARSTFSFADEVEPTTMQKPDLIDENAISGPYGRGSPGDAALMAMVNKDRASTDLSRRKSQFYSEVFAYREPNVTARDRVNRYSVITCEVKTNVIVKDEYTFLQDLSQHLSQRYSRPISSIFITLNHSECLLFAGNFDSAYIITITALPSQLQPTTNKRNTVVIQTFLSDLLGVLPDRGIIRFVPIAEEYLATNGNTVQGEIDNLSKDSSEDTTDTNKRSNTLLGRGRSRKSSRPEKLNLQKERSRPQTSDSKVPSPALQSPPVPDMPREMSPMDRRAEKVRKMGRRRSFLAMISGGKQKITA
ncbi:MAG: hypothetical protein L6R41_001744 [Letrouitia leprolyta]|nr:MAG: hypothetical protein L6R41_001744 [Letrouitia leprolyta]